VKRRAPLTYSRGLTIDFLKMYACPNAFAGVTGQSLRVLL
jgi:hypothetical protein